MNTDDYRSHIDRLIREMSGETVLNGSSAHASIIVERMFANASKCVEILSRRFDPRIYGSHEAIEQADLLLGDPERKIRIILEEVDTAEISSHPFFARLHRHMERGNLELRQMQPELKDAVSVNFATMDDTGYRFEQDKSQAVAVASFGDRAFVSSLRSFFDRLWLLSSPVPVAVTA